MSTAKASNSKLPKTIPLWLAYSLFAIVWGVVPWALSLLTPHYGWAAGRPSLWNWLGLIPLAVGLAGSIWGLSLHAAESREGVDFEPDKSYLITRGAYGFSRNPMYLAELTLMVGWVLFYGSVAVFVVFLAWWVIFSFVHIPSEERTIEARFGEVYREYKRRVPRWIGRIRS